MPDVRYSVPGVPPGPAQGLSAFTPGLTRAAGSGAQSYKYALAGYPGTRAIPAPASALNVAGGVVGQQQQGTARSTDAPDAFWPNQYYQSFIAEPPGAGMPVAVYDPVRPGLTTLLPVPAVNVDLYGRSNQDMKIRAAVLQRVRQLPWFPRVYKAPSA